MFIFKALEKVEKAGSSEDDEEEEMKKKQKEEETEGEEEYEEEEFEEVQCSFIIPLRDRGGVRSVNNYD